MGRRLASIESCCDLQLQELLQLCSGGSFFGPDGKLVFGKVWI
jgi:hypothetical protein